MRPLSLIAITIALIAAGDATAEDLSGSVTDAKGQPLAGATVWIVAAEPRAGAALRCETCYDDVGRKAKTGPDGQYVFLEVDPWLVFRVAATADGYRADLANKADPVPGKPFNFTLQPLAASLPPERRVRARVVDTDGKPVAGVLVESYGVKRGSTRSWGGLDRFGVDPYAVTNADGEFVITAGEPIDAYDFDVRAARLAPRKFMQVPTGEDMENHKLTVDVGVAVSGRIVKDGKPVAGIVVGLSHVDRSSTDFQGDFKIATDADGKFEFPHLPAKLDYYFYTTMNSAHGAGSLTVRAIRTGAVGTSRALGDLPLAASHALSGRIVLADGKKLPGQFTIYLSREWASDYATPQCDASGDFRIENIPNDESITLSPRIPGYRVVGSQPKFQLVRNGGIALHVDRSRDNIEIILEPDVEPR